MTEMGSKLILITPEIILFAGSVLVAVLGLSRSRSVRGVVPWTTTRAVSVARFMANSSDFSRRSSSSPPTRRLTAASAHAPSAPSTLCLRAILPTS